MRPRSTKTSLTHLNPSGLHTNPAFSQGVRIDAGNLVLPVSAFARSDVLVEIDALAVVP